MRLAPNTQSQAPISIKMGKLSRFAAQRGALKDKNYYLLVIAKIVPNTLSLHKMGNHARVRNVMPTAY